MESGSSPTPFPRAPSGFGSQLGAGVPLFHPTQNTHHTRTLLATTCWGVSHRAQAAPRQGPLGSGAVGVWGERLEGLHQTTPALACCAWVSSNAEPGSAAQLALGLGKGPRCAVA